MAADIRLKSLLKLLPKDAHFLDYRSKLYAFTGGNPALADKAKILHHQMERFVKENHFEMLLNNEEEIRRLGPYYPPLKAVEAALVAWKEQCGRDREIKAKIEEAATLRAQGKLDEATRLLSGICNEAPNAAEPQKLLAEISASMEEAERRLNDALDRIRAGKPRDALALRQTLADKPGAPARARDLLARLNSPFAHNTFSLHSSSGVRIRIFRSSKLTLGRIEENHVHFPNEFLMSKFHAEVRLGDTGVEIVDKGSKNGTFLNGKKIVSETVRDEVDLEIVKGVRCRLRPTIGPDGRVEGATLTDPRGSFGCIRTRLDLSALKGPQGISLILAQGFLLVRADGPARVRINNEDLKKGECGLLNTEDTVEVSGTAWRLEV